MTRSDGRTVVTNTAGLAPLEYEFSLPGIWSVVVHPSCSDRANRYDLMIEIGMDPEALPAYDACEPHHVWKEQYGGAIAHKVIFDCE